MITVYRGTMGYPYDLGNIHFGHTCLAIAWHQLGIWVSKPWLEAHQDSSRNFEGFLLNTYPEIAKVCWLWHYRMHALKITTYDIIVIHSLLMIDVPICFGLNPSLWFRSSPHVVLNIFGCCSIFPVKIKMFNGWIKSKPFHSWLMCFDFGEMDVSGNRGIDTVRVTIHQWTEWCFPRILRQMW
jgi:hypothetical protein